MPDSNADPKASSVALGYKIVPIEPGHAGSLAEAHSICFPGYFLTSLGRPYVRLFYRALAVSDIGVAVVAVDGDGRVVCFAAGATKSDDFRQYFFRNYFFASAWALVGGFLGDRDVRRYVLTQGYRVIDALVLLAKKRPKPDLAESVVVVDKKPVDNLNAYSLMSMGALPECRGSNMASEIITAFESSVLKRGGNAVKTSTGKENKRALNFYIKNGYQVYRDTRPGDVDLIKIL